MTKSNYRTRGRPEKTYYDAVIVKQSSSRLKKSTHNDTEKNEDELCLSVHAATRNEYLVSLYRDFNAFFLQRNSLCPLWH